VAYEVELPERCRIHNIFHVSCLKKALGQHVVTSSVPSPTTLSTVVTENERGREVETSILSTLQDSTEDWGSGL
jgi:hypothetical protein